MATVEQEAEAQKQLKDLLSQLSSMKATSLARKELGSDLSFESGAMFFDRTLRLLNALNEADLDDLSYQTITQIQGQAQQVLSLYSNIRNFSIKQFVNNPIAQRDSFIQQARDQYDGVFQAVAPAIAFAVRKGTDFSRLEAQAKATVERMQELAESQEETTKKVIEDANQVLDEVRRIAEEAGVSQHASYFKNEADSNELDAKPWLRTTIALASITALLSLGLTIRYFFVLPSLTATQSVQLAIPKIFLFSVLLSATVWSGRTYRAYRHNAVVNRHRQNALASFEAFAKAASSDTETKNAVLLQATQCIYSSQPTGYIQTESETAMPHVLEIFRSGVGKTG